LEQASFFTKFTSLGPSIKDVRTQGVVQCGQGGRGFHQIRTSALFDAKNFRFFEFMVCPHRQGRKGVEPVRTFCEQGRRVNFSRFCADVLYGRSLFMKLLACLHDQNKSVFLEGRLFSSQSEQSEKFLKSPNWLEKSRPSKKPLLF